MVATRRILDIDLPRGQSAFLWGPRKAGKTTYLRQAFPDSILYDFLKTDVALNLNRNPALLREQLLANRAQAGAAPVILDEVQKAPAVMDEVHWLIENEGLSFILCGSSARKLKKGGANLLGGRAWRFELFPFVFPELEDFNLLQALNQGLVPAHYLATNYQRSLRAYAQDYQKEEVLSEGLVRNIPAFSRFFEALGYSHGGGDQPFKHCAGLRHRFKNRKRILPDTGGHLVRRLCRAVQKKTEARGYRQGLQILSVRCGRGGASLSTPDR